MHTNSTAVMGLGFLDSARAACQAGAPTSTNAMKYAAIGIGCSGTRAGYSTAVTFKAVLRQCRVAVTTASCCLPAACITHGGLRVSMLPATAALVVGHCAACSLSRQSRLLRFDSQGYQLYTVDHVNDGKLRLDLQHQWADSRPPAPVTPEHEMIPDAQAGWLTSRLECATTDSMDEELGRVQWIVAGPTVLLGVQCDLLVEYNTEMRAPVGLVAFLNGEEPRDA